MRLIVDRDDDGDRYNDYNNYDDDDDGYGKIHKSR